MAIVKVTEQEVKNAVEELLNTNEWPIYRTQDDNGLDEHEYFEFVRDVLRKLGTVAGE
jgi:hypothetical protein